MARMIGEAPIPIVCQTIGAAIRDEREKQGLSLQQLSDRAAIEQERLEEFESGEGEAYASEIVDIARALGVDPAHFFTSLMKEFRSLHGGPRYPEKSKN